MRCKISAFCQKTEIYVRYIFILLQSPSYQKKTTYIGRERLFLYSTFLHALSATISASADAIRLSADILIESPNIIRIFMLTTLPLQKIFGKSSRRIHNEVTALIQKEYAFVFCISWFCRVVAVSKYCFGQTVFGRRILSVGKNREL